jgi:hypothetical protein
MNVNSCGHNLDTRYKHHFPEIKIHRAAKPVGCILPLHRPESIDISRTDSRGAGQNQPQPRLVFTADIGLDRCGINRIHSIDMSFGHREQERREVQAVPPAGQEET